MLEMSLSKEALRVEHLSHHYAETPVLFDVSLTLERGEVLALVGPSGSGKSTLLHLIGALEPPQKGRILWGEVELNLLKPEERARARRQKLGLIFQHHYLLEDLTALENTGLPGLIAGKPDANRAQALLEKVGLGHRITHLPNALSGGERQRVALARALMLRPPLLLADEPTGSLDQKNAAQVMDLLLELAFEEGAGVMLVTHDERLSARAHRTLNLLDGRLV